ncbi:LptA/OstA family protein [Kovacikia minuta]|uniref:LptA/OstA family protein n=1 Tax=Kovacikia minuta TaxID=2931930 RepID=UPI001CEDD4E2|nr:LptA/OstA family protein [Kovacikia minuta]
MMSPYRRFRLSLSDPKFAGIASITPARVFGILALSILLLDSVNSLFPVEQSARAQTTTQPLQNRAMTLYSDVQEANAKTGVVTARGNVQINYPARQIQATAAQAQYYSRERRIVLSGNVYVLQQGNSMRGETITYLIDEGRFVALPAPTKQVESTYLVPESSPSPTPTATQSPLIIEPEFTPSDSEAPSNSP